MEQLTALAIIVSVMAQAITLVVLHRTISNQVAQANKDHARRLEIDRDDRLRRAYGNLIKAAKSLLDAFNDLNSNPEGHDYPGTISGIQTPPDHNRYALVADLDNRARELVLEAEAVILLDHEADLALGIYRNEVEEIYHHFMVDCIVYGAQKDARERRDKFVAAKKSMEAAARGEFPVLPTPRTE
jgi:hypothetical protein